MVRAALFALFALFFVGSLARAAPEFFMEAEIEPKRVYVGAEARLVLRVFRAPGVLPGSLRPPLLGEAGTLSLLNVRTYEAARGGVTYRVFERSNIVVPRRAGRLVVPGAEFETAQHATELFERRLPAPRIEHGPQVTIEVLPVPAGAAEPFLPAHSLSLSESWSRDIHALTAGEPVTRTLLVVAEGLAAERLPRLAMAEDPWVTLHHDQPELSTSYSERGSVGRRLQRIVLMPMREGELALPELSVRWWDVAADAERVTALPARTLVLHPAIAPPAAPASAPPLVSPGAILQWFAFALFALSGLALWLYLRGQAMRDARVKLRDACARNDPRAARDALADWEEAARTRAPIDREPLNAALYAGRPWDGRAFWREVKPRLKKPPRAKAPGREALGLFKLQA